MGNIRSISKIADKFWAKVDIKGKDECWIWKKGAKFSRGKTAKTIRGYFYYCGHTWRAHRIAWMITYGPIPKGKCVLHKCDNSICVNPNHLHLGTAKDNMREKVRRGRQYKKISDKAVRQIRTLANQGRSRKEIAGKFGISKSHVGNIVRRKSRRYLKRN